jgi:hypothetical protein
MEQSGDSLENPFPSGPGTTQELSCYSPSSSCAALDELEAAENLITCTQPRDEPVLQDATDRVLNSQETDNNAPEAMVLSQHPTNATAIGEENERREATCTPAVSHLSALQGQASVPTAEEEKRRADISAYKAALAAASKPQRAMTQEPPQGLESSGFGRQPQGRQAGARVLHAPGVKQPVLALPKPAVPPSIPCYTNVSQADGTFRMFHKQQVGCRYLHNSQ